jgi:beta-glucosidase
MRGNRRTALGAAASAALAAAIAASTQAVPAQALPGRAVAGQAVPGWAVAGQAVPGRATPGQARPWLNPSETPDQRAGQLVAQMTLDEKISQMHTTGTGAGGIARLVPGIPRLGIPDFRITNGPAGVGTGSVSTQPSATALPAPVALAATFDTGLARQYGTVEGVETADVGHGLIEAPDVNMVRVPQSGRAFENYGEDPYLAGQLAVADIDGIQSQGVMAEVKHYAANDQETNRKTINERIDDRTQHEIHLPAFEAAVRQGNVAAVMCAYPSVNGEFMCQNRYLLSDVLRDQWGFDGFIQSDAGATHSAAGSAQAGMDLELADNGPYDQELEQAVLDGQVSVSTLDSLIVRRLATEIRFGLLDRVATTTPIDAAAGGAVARAVSEQSTVLLKNSGSQLPLDTGAVHSIAVIGQYAQTAYPGGGGSSHVNPLYTVSPVQGITQRAGPGATVTSSDGGDVTQAAAQAAAADVAVVIVSDAEKEGSDRANLSLTGNQDQLVGAVAAANPHTVVVVDSGAPVLMPWVDQVPAVVEAWYPGEEDGDALAAVLFGDVDPSGKLPVTFPRTGTEVPANTPQQYPGVGGTAVYSEGLEVGYRWYDAQHVAPLFPFGYGLSYTSFAYSHLRVTPAPGPDGTVTATVDVTNTGSRSGADVAQVYVTDPAAAGEPPIQLKGFQKVSLAPGQTRRLTFTLDQRAFSIWNSDAQDWTRLDGTYTVSVGDSSANLPLHAPVILARTAGVRYLTVTAPQVLAPGATATVTTTFTNTGDYPADQVRLALDAPAGWTVSPADPVSLPPVGPRTSAGRTWQLTAPPGAAPGTVALSVTARYHGVDGDATARAGASVTVPSPSLAAAFGNVGITDDTATDAGNIDGTGSSLSAQALAGAGVTPGAAVAHGAVSLTWPAVAAGQPDNVVAAGQAIAASGSGGTLGFLLAATYGPATGTGRVIYSDGGTQPFTLDAPDWYSATSTGADVAIGMPYRNKAGNVQQAHVVNVYYAGVPLQAGRTVADVVLPDVSSTATAGSPAMHIFAMSIG